MAALSPAVAASVLRAAADAGVRPDVTGAYCIDEFNALWAAANIGPPDSEVDDETWLARERLKVRILERGLTGGWLEDLVFGNIVSLVQPYTVLRDAPRRGRR
jgi:hypothetical protein